MNIRQYTVNINKAICRLLPYYLRGRRLISLLEGSAKPLDDFNNGPNAFHIWAKETLIKASMTAQPIKLERYLNYLFKDKWKLNGDIKIQAFSPTMCVLYRKDECFEHQTANGKNVPYAPNMSPIIMRSKGEKSNIILNTKANSPDIGVNILISIPKLNASLNHEDCIRQIKKIVNTYIPVTGTYTIRIQK